MEVFLSPSVAVLQDGELVTFSEVVGATELNNHKPIKVKNCKVRSSAWIGWGPRAYNLLVEQQQGQ